MRSIRHGGDVTPGPLGATWTPIRCNACGSIVQWMRTGSAEDSRLWCGACHRALLLSETTATGAIVLVREGESAKAAI